MTQDGTRRPECANCPSWCCVDDGGFLMQSRESIAAEPCRCVRCVMCSGTGRVRVDHWSGYDTEPCEDCDNGITEPCGRCELLADWDREAPYDWAGQAEL